MHTRDDDQAPESTPRKKGRRGSRVTLPQETTVEQILEAPVKPQIDAEMPDAAREEAAPLIRKRRSSAAQAPSTRALISGLKASKKRRDSIPFSVSADAAVTLDDNSVPVSKIKELLEQPLSSPLKSSGSLTKSNSQIASPIKKWDAPLTASNSSGSLQASQIPAAATPQQTIPEIIVRAPTPVEELKSPSPPRAKVISQSTEALGILREKQIISDQMTNNTLAEILHCASSDFQQLIYIDHLDPEKSGELGKLLNQRAAMKVDPKPVESTTSLKVNQVLGPVTPRNNIRLFCDAEGNLYKVSTADIQAGKLPTPEPVEDDLYAFLFVKKRQSGIHNEDALVELRICRSGTGMHPYLIGKEEEYDVIAGGELLIKNKKFVMVNTKTGNFINAIKRFEHDVSIGMSGNEFAFTHLVPENCLAPNFKFYDWNAISDEKMGELIERENLKVKIMEKPLNFLLKYNRMEKVEITEAEKEQLLESFRLQILAYLDSSQSKEELYKLTVDFYNACVAKNEEIKLEANPAYHFLRRNLKDQMIAELEKYISKAISEMKMLTKSYVRDIKARYCDILLHKEILKYFNEEHISPSKFTATNSHGKSLPIFPENKREIPDVEYSFFPKMYDDWKECFIMPAYYIYNNIYETKEFDYKLFASLLTNLYQCGESCIETMYKHRPTSWDDRITEILHGLHTYKLDRERLIRDEKFRAAFKNSLQLIMHYRDNKSLAYCMGQTAPTALATHSVVRSRCTATKEDLEKIAKETAARHIPK